MKNICRFERNKECVLTYIGILVCDGIKENNKSCKLWTAKNDI